MKKDTVIAGIKLIGGLVISIGVGAIAANLINATTPADTRKIMKSCIVLSSSFIAGFAGKAARNKFDKVVDGVVKTVEHLVEDKTPEMGV